MVFLFPNAENCTIIPGCTQAGSGRLKSHMASAVVPSNCQPPGLALG